MSDGKRTPDPSGPEGMEPLDATLTGSDVVIAPDGATAIHRVGPYRVVRRIGEGGMSVVYEAEHSGRGRREALKILRSDLEEDPTLAERFHREVRAMSALRHDHVLEVYDSGEEDGRLYYTMPLLPGPTLSELVREIVATGEKPPGARANEVLDRHDLPPSPVEGERAELAFARRVAAALAGVADALSRMHENGVLHRDVKPSNLMLDENTRLLVTDFGIARTSDQRLTRTDQSLGTPAYMSPEQIARREQPLDGRTDVYSLGATLYELLTLELPHQGETIAETLQHILERRARPASEANPHLPPQVETIVARCLETSVRDRYADAASLRDDLRAFAAGDEIRARPVSPARRAAQMAARHWRTLGAAALVALIGLGWYFARPATLTVRTFPPGLLSIDATPIGDTPVQDHELRSGRHAIRVTGGDLFEDLETSLHLGPGHSREIERVLRARDPGDPAVIQLIAKAHGVERTDVEVTTMRGIKWAPELHLLWPRGLVTEPPTEIVVWSDIPFEGRAVTLSENAPGSVPIATWEVPSERGEARLAIPPDARAGLESGTTYRVVADALHTDFQILSDDARRELAATLNRETAMFDPDDPSALFVRGELLLRAGLLAEAYDEARKLAGVLGSRREVARLALAVLDAADARGVGPWAAWANVYERDDDATDR